MSRRTAAVVVQSLSHVWLFVTPGTIARLASLTFTISWSLLKLMSIEPVMPSNHLIVCCPLLVQLSVFPSLRVFSSESALDIRWPKYWSFSISPSNEHSGLISFRIDWFDLFSIQGILKSLLQHQRFEKWKLLSCVQLFVTPWMYNPWNSPSQNTGVGSLFSSLGDLPGIKPMSPTLQEDSLQLSHKGSSPEVWKNQFFGTQPSSRFNYHICT